MQVKTGEKAPISGQYKVVGEKREITLVKNKKVPPAGNGINKFVLVDKTKHERGK